MRDAVVAVCVYAWVCVGVLGCVQIGMSVPGCAWLCLGVVGYLDTV